MGSRVGVLVVGVFVGAGVVGSIDGVLVGAVVGVWVGELVGDLVGAPVGATVGRLLRLLRLHEKPALSPSCSVGAVSSSSVVPRSVFARVVAKLGAVADTPTHTSASSSQQPRFSITPRLNLG